MEYFAITVNGIEVPEYGTYCSKKTAILVMRKLTEAMITKVGLLTKFETFGES